jgi:hypothetical protein
MDTTNKILTKQAKFNLKKIFSGMQRVSNDATKYVLPLNKKTEGFGKFISKHKLLTLGAGAAALGAGDVIKEVVIDPAKLKADQVNAYNNMEKKVTSLQGISPEKKKDYFKVISMYAPSLSRNPYVAGNLINKFNEYGGPDHKIVQDIIKMEKDFETKSKGSIDKMISRAGAVVSSVL